MVISGDGDGVGSCLDDFGFLRRELDEDFADDRTDERADLRFRDPTPRRELAGLRLLWFFEMVRFLLLAPASTNLPSFGCDESIVFISIKKI